MLWHLDSRFEGGHLLLGRCRVFETSSLLWRLDCSSLGCNRLVKSPIEAECFEGRLNKVLGASNGVTSSWVGALHSKRLRSYGAGLQFSWCSRLVKSPYGAECFVGRLNKVFWRWASGPNHSARRWGSNPEFARPLRVLKRWIFGACACAATPVGCS